MQDGIGWRDFLVKGTLSMASDVRVVGKPSILRIRAGFLLLIALAIFCVSAGRFVAVTLTLGWGWGAGAVVVCCLLLGWGIARLTRKIYLLLAAAVTLLTSYFVYDFLRVAMGLSSTTSLLLAVIPFLLVGAAFWDFRTLKEEIVRWLNAR
ncbi:MAG: hypothetical protein B7Z15_05050 [Rhizobiales bacterium 32-66-8]|nr:MAG: hypothetical protein B7Z15_05050 [Rhizobiales bacterium 32-66-8]